MNDAMKTAMEQLQAKGIHATEDQILAAVKYGYSDKKELNDATLEQVAGGAVDHISAGDEGAIRRILDDPELLERLKRLFPPPVNRPSDDTPFCTTQPTPDRKPYLPPTPVPNPMAEVGGMANNNLNES